MTDGDPGRLLPPARRPGSYRIGVVCLGNICRSPMAAVVLEARLAEAGLVEHVRVVSSGTADWHVGRPMDPRAAATLAAHGYDPTRHRARQWDRSAADDERPDLVLAMDAQNLQDLRDVHDGPDPGERLLLFRSFDPQAGHGPAEVPDPYYGGDSGFEEVLVMVERTVATLVELVRREQPWSGGGPE